MATLRRLGTGHYRLGEVDIVDTYSPSGPAHVRYPTKTRGRWLIIVDNDSRRFDTLRRAREWATGLHLVVEYSVFDRTYRRMLTVHATADVAWRRVESLTKNGGTFHYVVETNGDK